MKNECKISSGRSMAEMLGVLAIIGVLSVGGIAGYSKAMMQFRINKTMSQVSYIASTLRTLFGTKDDYTPLGTDTNITLLEKSKVLPDEMVNIAADGTKSLKSPFGKAVAVMRGDLLEEGDNAAFMIYYYYIPREACISIASRDWGSASSSGFVAIGINEDIESMQQVYQGCTKIAGYGKAIACGAAAGTTNTTSDPLTLVEASEACMHPSSNAIAWKFY